MAPKRETKLAAEAQPTLKSDEIVALDLQASSDPFDASRFASDVLRKIADWCEWQKRHLSPQFGFWVESDPLGHIRDITYHRCKTTSKTLMYLYKTRQIMLAADELKLMPLVIACTPQILIKYKLANEEPNIVTD